MDMAYKQNSIKARTHLVYNTKLKLIQWLYTLPVNISAQILSPEITSHGGMGLYKHPIKTR